LYQYLECGLDKIDLLSGVTVGVAPEYGETFSIENLAGLHLVITGSIISQERLMNGAEFRFLRIELDLSRRRLAELLATSAQNIANWETRHDRPIESRSADCLLRNLHANARGERRSESTHMPGGSKSKESSPENERVHSELDSDGWRLSLAAYTSVYQSTKVRASLGDDRSTCPSLPHLDHW
jgi:DNA-binding transcriptional regulator YiaG